MLICMLYIEWWDGPSDYLRDSSHPLSGKSVNGTKLTTKLLVPFGAKIKNNKAHYHLVCEAAQSLRSKVCNGVVK